MKRAAALLLLLLLAGGAAPSPRVPFVGCPSDGQLGPQHGPRRGAAPRVAAPAAAGLAYYRSSELGVLAPRGWRCFALYGSNGSTLVVTPERHGFDDLTRRGLGPGPAVQLSVSFGGTSGRFEVARTIARLFPARMGFVRSVAAEGLEGPFPTGPYPGDRLVRRSATEVEVTTPAGRRGFGADSYLAPGNDRIRGLAILLPQDDMNLVTLYVRLPSRQAALAPAIAEYVRRTSNPRE